MKAGYCYCDIKIFPSVVACMSLIAIWFNQNRYKQSKEIKLKRKEIINELKDLPLNMMQVL